MMVSGRGQIKTAFFLKHRATHGFLGGEWRSVNASSMSLFLCAFCLVDKYQAFPKDAVRSCPVVKEIGLQQDCKVRGMSENRDKKEVKRVWPFLNFSCKFALYLEILWNSFLHWISSLALPAAVCQPLLPSTGSSL